MNLCQSYIVASSIATINGTRKSSSQNKDSINKNDNNKIEGKYLFCPNAPHCPHFSLCYAFLSLLGLDQ
jgi:hypothetical protein